MFNSRCLFLFNLSIYPVLIYWRVSVTFDGSQSREAGGCSPRGRRVFPETPASASRLPRESSRLSGRTNLIPCALPSRPTPWPGRDMLPRGFDSLTPLLPSLPCSINRDSFYPTAGRHMPLKVVVAQTANPNPDKTNYQDLLS